MIEIPEASTLARQVNESLANRTVRSVIAGAFPHKFAWFRGDPADYPRRLEGAVIQSAASHGGMVEVRLDRATLLFHDGVNLRIHPQAGDLPAKHQLLVSFDDNSVLSASVQMYGGVYCWERDDDFDYSYYNVAHEKPSPLDTNQFTEANFLQLLADPAVQKVSTKAALATNQRVPGLGNGVLQDILWNARISPKRKINTLYGQELHDLYISLTTTLAEMTRHGGRDTEKNLYGDPGEYVTTMSAKNAGAPCPQCGNPIRKEAYMGGSVYYCPECQK